MAIYRCSQHWELAPFYPKTHGSMGIPVAQGMVEYFAMGSTEIKGNRGGRDNMVYKYDHDVVEDGDCCSNNKRKHFA